MGDFAECTAISEVFGRYRKDPIPVGSVKTNMGHSEIASGLCGILKAIAAMRTGIIPGNIYSEPLDETLPGLKDEKLTVSTIK